MIIDKTKLPDVVYKYRSFEKSKDRMALEDNIVYMASPKQFNDPFDCKIYERFTLLSDIELENYKNDFVKNRWEMIHDHEPGITFDEALKKLNYRFTDLSEADIEFAKINSAMTDERMGVFSSSSVWDGISMWAYYADNYKGFCMGYDTQKLVSQTESGKMGFVQYSEVYPELKPKVYTLRDPELMERSFIASHTKSNVWKHEEEFRIMKLYLNTPNDDDRKYEVSDETLTEVILGLLMKEEHKQAIMRICLNKKIPVYQLELKKFSYGFEKIKVEALSSR